MGNRTVFQDKIKRDKILRKKTSSKAVGGELSIGESKRREANKKWFGVVGLSPSFVTSPAMTNCYSLFSAVCLFLLFNPGLIFGKKKRKKANLPSLHAQRLKCCDRQMQVAFINFQEGHSAYYKNSIIEYLHYICLHPFPRLIFSYCQ